MLFAADPYETIAFKVPNLEVDKSEGRFFSNWDKAGKSFTLQLQFKAEARDEEGQSDAASAAAPLPPPPPPAASRQYMDAAD